MNQSENSTTRKTVGGLSETTHRRFNAIKYIYGFTNADELLSEMMEVCELVGLLRNPHVKNALKEYSEKRGGSEAVVMMIIDALNNQNKEQ